jgi:hypothetical protein
MRDLDWRVPQATTGGHAGATARLAPQSKIVMPTALLVCVQLVAVVAENWPWASMFAGLGAVSFMARKAPRT